MRKILKLCLLASITSTCGCIDAMATTTHEVHGHEVSSAEEISGKFKAGAIVTVESGHALENKTDVPSLFAYDKKQAIDVMAGDLTTALTYVEGGTSNTGYSSTDNGKFKAGCLIGSGTVIGYVVRHHNGEDLEWSENNAVYTISSNPFTEHGFIDNNITMIDAVGSSTNDKFYEAIDSDNKLYRLYRDVDTSTTKIASGKTAKLSVAVRQASLAPAADKVTIDSHADMQHFGYSGGGKTIGKVIYVNSSAVKSIDPQKAFAIDLIVDSDTTASYSIEANLLNGNGSDTNEDITSLSVNTGTKGLSFTGANNFAGYDTTNGTGKGSLVDLNIGNATVKGSVTFGGSGSSDNGAATAMNGIGNVTVTNDGSVLTLIKGTDTELTTAGDWKFVGTAKLVSNIPMVIAAGTTCSFGASVPTGQS